MTAGRPLKFPTVESLQERIDLYFNNTKEEEWTVTGLALALDTNRDTLINYTERPEYFDTIKKAKEMVHNAYEKDLRRKGRSGDIFALKNFGWSDKQEIDHTTKGESINPLVGELTKQLNELHRSRGSGGYGGTSSPMDTEASD